jgi:hypothetical protein
MSGGNAGDSAPPSVARKRKRAVRHTEKIAWLSRLPLE